MGILLIASIISIRQLNHALKQAIQFYTWVGMICVSTMIVTSHYISPTDEIPTIIFAYHMGVFSLGLILGFRAALKYAILTSILLIGIGFLYQDIGNSFTAIVLLYGMTLPSWLVDRLERDLHHSEEKFGMIFREALDGILVLDSATQTVLRANTAAAAILGYTEASLPGQPIAALLPLDAPLAQLRLPEELHPGGSYFPSQTALRRDRTLCPVDVTITMIPWETQQAALVTLRDVTARHQTEAELARHREHLEELVRDRTAALEAANAELQQRSLELEATNEDLNAFSYTVAHDLKNTLTALIGFASLLEKRYERMTGERLRATAQAIAQNGRKMNNIINELLVLASVRKLEAIHQTPLDMAAIVAEAQARLVDLITEQQAEIILPEAWPTACGYAPWIEEVWMNYISNAIKYGGVPPRMTLGGTPLPDGRVCFWVHDNGQGLHSEEQARLFTAFTRLETVRVKGHGLGLSIVRRIVEKLGGEVGIESLMGQGSTFTFTLPGTSL